MELDLAVTCSKFEEYCDFYDRRELVNIVSPGGARATAADRQCAVKLTSNVTGRHRGPKRKLRAGYNACI